jgi:hypothetical protein
MTIARLERIVFLLLPLAVLGFAFAGICIMVGSIWPWHAVVHEDGTRTLLDTVFYFEHATRELLPDLVLAAAVAGAVRWFLPPACRRDDARRSRRQLALLTAATTAVILGATFWSDGGRTVVDNLSQSHTRAGAPLVWGAHWRYHFLDRLALALAAFSATGVVWIVRGRPDSSHVPGRQAMYRAALLLFALATAGFRVTGEPFTDPAFLGHQLRELFTHGLVTFPLALGVCLALARRFAAPAGAPSSGPVWSIALTGAASVMVAAFLLVASVLTGAQDHGQTTGLAALLLPHFAEHALGYVFVPSLAGLLYLSWCPAGGAVAMPARGRS